MNMKQTIKRLIAPSTAGRLDGARQGALPKRMLLHRLSVVLVTLLLTMTAQTAWAQATIGGITYDANGGYYVIDEPDDLRDLATYVNGTGTYRDNSTESTAHDCSGLKFKMTQNITFTATTAWNDANSTESNYEAIGCRDGSTDRYFRGDFDGAGHTISGIRIHRSGSGDADKYQGIFGQTSSAKIHRLRLADARITGYDNTGGIVGRNYDGTVTDCHVASNVCIHAAKNNTYYHGGIAGRNEAGTVGNCTSAATLTIASGATDCQFYGAIAGDNSLSIGTLRDNLAIGATVPAANNYHGAIAGRNYSSATLQRNYYTACTVAGVANATGQGCANADVDGARHAVRIVAADGVTIVPTGTATTYAVSGITIYAGNNGISYDGQFYAGATEQVELTLSNTAPAPAGYQYDGYTASAGTLSGSTLTMPDANVTIAAALAVIPWSGDGDTKDDPYIILYPSQLDLLAHRVNGTHGEILQSDGYSGKYFRLGADIAYTYSDAWNVANSTENNYEAIGGYYDSNGRYFKGDFDGAGHTISGIRIHRSGNDYADQYQGIFGQTSKANIHSLRLADARITGYDKTGGIVGSNGGSTVTDCHVASNVCIHAARSGAWNHGGIAGENYGTVENCTSAATLTIPSGATNCLSYGAIAGYNNRNGTGTLRGTLRDNLAIGATVPAAKNNYHGAIAGRNDGTLQRNYYTACTVAGVANATGQGYQNADVTADDGAVPLLSETNGVSKLTALLAGKTDVPVSFTRSGLAANAYSTMCLPFGFVKPSDCTFYAFKGIHWDDTESLWVADVTETTTLAAHTPYIFKCSDTEATFSGTIANVPADISGSLVEVGATEGDDTAWKFKGTYTALDWTSADPEEPTYGFSTYVPEQTIAAGTFVRFVQGASLAPFRARLIYSGSDSHLNAPARSRTAQAEDELPGYIIVRIIGTDGTTTAIGTLDTATGQLDTDGWYTLGGRKLDGKPTQKGIYINNGKKIVIK